MAEEVISQEEKDAKAQVHQSKVYKGHKNVRYLQRMKDKGKKIVQACPVGLGPIFGMIAEVAGVDILRICSLLGCNDMTEEEFSAVPTIREYRALAKNIHINYYIPVSTFASKEKAVSFSANLIQNGADTVLPMGVTNEVLKYMADNYVAVYGHVGAISGWQTVATGYAKVGKTAEDALRIFKMAYEYQENGMKAMSIELTPMEVTAAIAKTLRIPVISIAGGSACDGSEMVDTDIFGINPNMASHAKKYADLFPFAMGAYAAWANDVRTGAYPEDKNGYHMDPEELDRFNEAIAKF